MADGPILSDNKLTILAGNGKVPIDVARAAQENGIEVFVICLGDEADPADFPSLQAERVAWGALGTLNKLLDKSGAQTLTLVGGIAKRPDLSAIRLDAGAVMALPKIVKLMAGGDESVLGKIARYFEGRGYRLLGAHEVAPSLLCREGLLGSVAVSPEAREDLVTACRGAGVAGQIDLGQAAISVNGRLVGLEGPEGTDGLLDRVAELRQRNKFTTSRKRHGVLAKRLRPGQDMRFDVPTIGPRTVEKAARAGLEGIALEAGHVFLADRAGTLQAANDAGIFILGVTQEDMEGA